MPKSKEDTIETASIQRKLKVLEAKKEMLFQRFQKSYNYLKDLDKPGVEKYFRIGLNNLESSKSQFSDLIEEINMINLELNEEFLPNYRALEAVEDMHCHILNAAQNLDSNSASNNSTPVNQSRINIKAEPKLPKIDLIEFSGDIRTWPVFYQNFKSCIHDNKDLDDSCKIQYLLGKLKGRALTLCSGVAPIAANYGTVWKILVDTYQDERLLATTYLRSIIEFKPLNSESLSNLNSFLEKFDVSVSALKQLKIQDLADFMLVHLALTKLDTITQKAFESTLSCNETPTYNKVINFVKQQAKILGRTASTTTSHYNSVNHANSGTVSKISTKPRITYSYYSVGTSENQSPYDCLLCNQANHTINKCSKFLKFTPTVRYNIAREKLLCLNCLSSKHRIASCRSPNTCNICNKRHHSLLHFTDQCKDNVEEVKSVEAKLGDSSQNVTMNYCSTVDPQLEKGHLYTTLLPTAEVVMSLSHGKSQIIRVLLDSGSQDNFISLKCCRNLKIPIHKKDIRVVGIGACSKPIQGVVHDIVISSRFNSEAKYTLDALVIDNLALSLPSKNVATDNLKFLDELPLADSQFYKSSEIDGILGIGVFSDILTSSNQINKLDAPITLNTSFGYIVTGRTRTSPLSFNTNIDSSVSLLSTTEDESSLETIVKEFFKLEEAPDVYHASPEDIACENHFQSSHTRDPSGRYTVSLPFRVDPSQLSDSFRQALKRFLSLEKKLMASSLLKFHYSEVIEDYLRQGHLRKVRELNDDSEDLEDALPHYFIPHHAVFKPSSVTTPVRIVFDASMETFPSMLSLNSCLYTGPKLQVDIVKMFLNFRLFQVALIADICQMYRQINLASEHQRFQRILWRFSPEQVLSIYELTTVAFGIKSSPFLALRVVQQLAQDEAQKYPLASQTILRDMYVDDLTSSVESVEKAKLLYSEMVALFRSGGFEITKWHTNALDFLLSIPPEKRTPSTCNFDNDIMKVLGIQWHPHLDILFFSVNLTTATSKKFTKRYILSQVSKIFDPLGILAPVILFAKLFIRKLWSIKLSWDADLPETLTNDWIRFETELPLLKEIQIPRWLRVTADSSISLIGFGDACLTSYGAVVYLRVVSGSDVCVNLICSKSKISPLKTTALPRLELSASLLLSKLLNYIYSVYSSRCKIENVVACTDSKIVLGWISRSPHQLKTFVANRVSKIQTNLPVSSWFFVRGKQNIADIVSRGLLPSDFVKNNHIWLNGPDWLSQPQQFWPIESLGTLPHIETLPEEQVISLSSVEDKNSFIEFIERCSSFTKLLYSMVYILRFIKILSHSHDISCYDLDTSERYLIKFVQSYHFKDLLHALKLGKTVPPSFRKLSPFLDNQGMIRVGGRLNHANVGYNYKHPYILPKRSHFCALLVDYYHRKYLHTGTYLLCSLLRNKYWILSCRNLVRQRLRACNYCFRQKPKPTVPPMADLPSVRVTEQVKPYLATGVDYAGPFQITLTRHRGVKTQKAYVCVFVCMTTKNVHLELASDLSTKTFLDALKRFISRRGPVKTLYSDCGTNFIGGCRYLSELQTFIKNSHYSDALKKELLRNSIAWKFNVPLAPHMGGLWESNVKSMKTHLFKVIGSQILSYEEFYTVLTQIEALLNSRPLCYMSDDPSDPSVLTPAHFTLTCLENLPSTNILEENLNRLDRKQLLDGIVQSYWRRWKEEYLHQLQSRYKWNSPSNPVKDGTIVVMMNETTPPLKWPIGVIEETFPGKDGVIRVASVRTSHGTFKRPIIKLCPLPTQ